VNFKSLVLILFLVPVTLIEAQETDSASNTESQTVVDTSYYEEEEKFISYSHPEDIERRYFDSNFKSRYNTDHFKYEPKVQKFTQWEQFKQWLMRWLQDFFNLQDKNAASKWFEYLQNFLAFILVVGVVFFIVKAILNKEGGWIFGRDSKAETIDHTNVEAKLQLANFSELVASSRKNGDYRLAIRFYYLWLLRKMSDKKLIEWDINKTNMDYLYEIQNKGLRERYSYHCYVYDYIWYGEFNLAEEEFRKVETSFNETLRSIDG
jgi:large-conductance mechanosensitive channel